MIHFVFTSIEFKRQNEFILYHVVNISFFCFLFLFLVRFCPDLKTWKLFSQYENGSKWEVREWGARARQRWGSVVGPLEHLVGSDYLNGIWLFFHFFVLLCLRLSVSEWIWWINWRLRNVKRALLFCCLIFIKILSKYRYVSFIVNIQYGIRIFNLLRYIPRIMYTRI